MNMSTAVRPLSQVKARMSEIVENMVKTREKVIITQNGEARAVLQDIESYKEMQDSLAMLKLLAMSVKSMSEGKGKPVNDAFRDI
jgi:prevent-host-death family protein